MFKFSLAIILLTVVMKKFQIDNEYCYNYIKYLFELGYHPKFYKYLYKFGDLVKKKNNLDFTIYIILYILFMIPLVKRSFFGGFANIFLSLGSFIISIITCLINLAFTIFSLYVLIYSILSFVCLILIKINFEDDNHTLYIKLFILVFAYLYLFAIFLVLFINNIKLSMYLYTVIKENKILGFIKTRFEDKFKFLNLSGQIITIEVDDSIDNKLFYKQINDEIDDINNQQINELPNKVLGLELNKEELLSESGQNDYFLYKREIFCLKGLIGNIIYLLIIGSFTLVFLIIALSTLIKNNKFYQLYRNYLLGQEHSTLGLEYEGMYSSYINDLFSNLSTFQRFWCDLAKVEVGVLVSFLIFLIIFILFEILSLLFHKGKITIFDINNGKL